MDAVARTHQGANPVIGQNPGGNAAAEAAARAAQANNPQQVYQNRFVNTPPVT